LLTLPFSEVALPFDEALAKLEGVKERVFSDCADYWLGLYQQHEPREEVERELKLLTKIRTEMLGEMIPGGRSMSEYEMTHVYRFSSFRTVVESLMEEAFPRFHQTNRRCGNEAAGYILDVLDILSPDMASFEDGAKLFAELSLRPGAYINPTFLGAFIDDTRKRWGAGDVPWDFFSDAQGAERLRVCFEQEFSGEARQAFAYGLEVPLREL